jgi:Ca-activated chloride channel homolog
MTCVIRLGFFLSIFDQYHLKEVKINYPKTIAGWLIATAFITLAAPAELFSQEELRKNRILFILDCSQSMSGQMNNVRKVDLAKKFLIKAVDSLASLKNVEVALRAFGHQSVVPPQDCSDTRLEVPFSPIAAQEIKRKIRYLEPKGTTPIANSLAQAAKDFPPASADVRNIIILITDGIEACDGDPCAVALDLKKKGIMLKPFIIGIGIDPALTKTFDCLGSIYNATDEQSFGSIFNIVITHALSETSMQVNLMDAHNNPTETDVAMTFYDAYTGKIRYNFIHTMNNRGRPDTLRIDPLTDYVVKVHTIPPVFSDTIRMSPGKHTITPVDAPQGTLLVNQKAGYQYTGLEFIIRKMERPETLSRQKIFMKTRYLTGFYDLEIPTIPATIIKGVEIKQSATTTVTLPQPGIITLLISTEGICDLFVEEGGDIRWIYAVNTNEKNIPITLLPGNYMIIYRPVHSRESLFTITKRFTIESGRSSSLRVF